MEGEPDIPLTLCFSALLGVGWSVVAVMLMGAGIGAALRPGWLAAGLAAGLATGAFTLWTRQRSNGAERWIDVVSTYFLGILVYWLTFVVVERVAMCIAHGGWTDFDLRDHLMLIVWFLVYGTIVYGILLVPLCFLTRRLVWGVHSRVAR